MIIGRTVLDGVVPYPPEFVERYRAAGYWLDRSLWELFAGCFTAHRDRVALLADDREVTYDALHDRCLTLAAALARRGLRRLDRVVLQLPNVPEAVYCYFALQRLGAVPIMALQAHRQAEISHFVRLSDAAAYFAGDASLATAIRLANPGLAQVVMLDELASLAGDPAILPAAGVDPLDPCVFLLSGGTTGLPKLIPRTHNDYWYNSVVASAVNDVGSGDALLVVLPLGHNFPLACPGLQGFLQRGARVVLSTSIQAADNFELIRRHRVTHLELVPALLIRWINDGALEVADLRSVRVVNTGGHRLQPEVKRHAEELLPNATVQEVFGMAEGLLNFVRLGDPEDERRETAGRPLSPGDEIRIVDDDGVDVASGEVGELLCRGPYTIRGYYRAPEHNAVAFTSDGYYRTGDLVRLTRHGNLVVEGRKKDLINRAGEKISAEEIENLIMSHPAVVNVACVPVPDPVLGERMCACVILRSGASLTLDELAAFLLEAGIAKFKLPERLELVEEFPMTQVGKVSKRELTELVVARS